MARFSLANPKPTPKPTTKASASKGKLAPSGSPAVAKKTKQRRALPRQESASASVARSRRLDRELLKAAIAVSKSAPLGTPLGRDTVRGVSRAVRRVLVAEKVIAGAENAVAILGKGLRFTKAGARVFEAFLRGFDRVPVAAEVMKQAGAKPKAAPAAAKAEAAKPMKSSGSTAEKLTGEGQGRLDAALLAAAKKGLSGQKEGEPVCRRDARVLCREVKAALGKGGLVGPAAMDTLIHLQKSLTFTTAAAVLFGRVVQRQARTRAQAAKTKLAAGKTVAKAKAKRKQVMAKAKGAK